MSPVPPLHVTAHQFLIRSPSGGSAVQPCTRPTPAHPHRRARRRLLLYLNFSGRLPMRPALPQDGWQPELCSLPLLSVSLQSDD